MKILCRIYTVYLFRQCRWSYKKKSHHKSGEIKKFKKTTVNDEIISFSELNFKYYAEIIELIGNMSEDSYVDVTDSDLGEAGMDINAYSEILRTVHKLIEVLEEEKTNTRNIAQNTVGRSNSS